MSEQNNRDEIPIIAEHYEQFIREYLPPTTLDLGSLRIVTIDGTPYPSPIKLDEEPYKELVTKGIKPWKE